MADIDIANFDEARFKTELFDVFGLLSPKTQDALVEKMGQQRLKIYRFGESSPLAQQPKLNNVQFIQSTEVSEVLPFFQAAGQDINVRMRRLNKNQIDQLFENHATLRQNLREINVFNKKVVHLNPRDPPPSVAALQHQLKLIHSVLAILKEVSSVSEDPGFFFGLIEKLRGAIDRLKSHITESAEPQIDKVLKGMKALVKSEKGVAKPLTKEERKQIIAELSNQTAQKVQAEMEHSYAALGITIGEQVSKQTGAETEALGSGGDACFADEIERRALERMGQDPKLQGSEKEKFEAYYRGAERSRPFNNALEAFFAFFENNPPENMSANDLRLLALNSQALTEEFYSQVMELDDGEMFFMNAGHLNHAFRVSVHRYGDQFEITLCEPGSGMEATILSHSGLAPQIRATMLKESGYPVHTGLRITVGRQHFKDVGVDYVRSLIERSAINLEDQLLCKPIADTIVAIEEALKTMSNWRFLSKLFLHIQLQIQTYRELIPWKAKWTKTLKVFAAIAPETARLLPQMQRQQRIGACYAKRLRPNATHEMGSNNYQQLNNYIHQVAKDVVLGNAFRKGLIDEKSAQELQALVPRKLAPVTLRQAAELLSRCETIPPHNQHPLTPAMLEENALALKAVVMMMNHAIARLAIPRSIKRPANTGLQKATFAEVLFSNPSVETLALATKVTRIRPTRFRTKEYVMEMEINGQWREVSKHAYLSLVLQDTELLRNKEISDNVMFLCKDRELTPQESQLKSKIIAFQRANLPKETDEALEIAEQKLLDMQKQLGYSITDAAMLPSRERLAIASTTAVLILQIENKLKALKDYRAYLQNPGLPETPAEALTRKNNPSYIAQCYFGAQAYAEECETLIRGIKDNAVSPLEAIANNNKPSKKIKFY